MTKINLKELIEAKRKSISSQSKNIGTISALVMNGDLNTERYILAKMKEFTDYGHEVIISRLDSDSTLLDNYAEIDRLIKISDAILIQEPHPFSKELNNHISKTNEACVDIEKYGKHDPTTESVLDILDFLEVSKDSSVSVLGGGKFGQQISKALLERRNTVFSCNSRTIDQEMIRNISDYTVLAYGSGWFDPIYAEKIIDVSFNINHDDTIMYEYTPMVGGTGKITTLNLLIKFNTIMQNKVFSENREAFEIFGKE
ncbi:MAG: hypothetical protein ACRCZ9_02415 [Fusobacteriaceae bacterium]